MGWKNLNWLEVEADIFSQDARGITLPLFESASKALDELYNKFIDALRQRPEKTADQAEATWHEKMWGEELHRERRQALGSLALDCVMSGLKKALRELKRHLDKRRPPAKQGYQGDGWLGKTKTEYKYRFGVDFDCFPCAFERIEEIVLARNAGIHREGNAALEYQVQISQPRFIDGNDQFFVDKGNLVKAIEDAEQFVKWVADKLTPLWQSPSPKTDERTG